MGEEINGAESPTLVSIRRRDDIWPPKFSSVRYLPRTGFSPTIMHEGGQGKRFVWPPPKQGQENGHDMDLASHGKVSNAWNPEANALGNRPPPFAPRTAPTKRCNDDIWPPKGSEYQGYRKPSPRPVQTVGRFEDYIKCRAGPSVPPTYRTPPGTQHIKIVELEGEYIHQSKTTTQTTTMNNMYTNQQRVVAQPAPPARKEVEEEEEVEYEEVEEEEEVEYEEVEEEEEEEESEEEEEEEE